MAGIVDFAQEVLGVGVVVSALLGIVAFLGRSQIAHWLNKDIERIKSQYQVELESQKASHMQALEAYKVSLIAEAERAKAAQAVKTAVAVKFSEHQFTAISQISAAMPGLSALTIFLFHLASDAEAQVPGATWEQFNASERKLSERHQVLKTAIHGGKLYFGVDDMKALLLFENLIAGIAVAACNIQAECLGVGSVNPVGEIGSDFLAKKTPGERMQLIVETEERVMKMLKRYADRFMSMQDS